MVCPICKKDKRVMCICGYCYECIEKYGHNKCKDIELERRNEK